MPMAAAEGGAVRYRRHPMNALTLAAEILGDTELTPGQLAQLRALDRKYAQRVYTLLHSESGTARELSEAEAADLEAKLRTDVLAVLTPEQQSRLRK
jgi:Spy/CpxP family protein refolding chaperone